MKKSLIALTLLASQLSFADASAEAERLVGVWDNEEKTSKIEISHCADDAKEYCGKIVSLKDERWPADDEMAGQLKYDRNNPDDDKNKQPIIGLSLMDGFEYDGDDVWEEGTIYDPKNGKTYSCKITMVNDKEIKVRGFIGFALLGRTTTWTR